MCRLMAYRGKPVSLSTWLIEPEHALMNQAKGARSCRKINGDGFGVAWYQAESQKGSNEPGLYKSVMPIWNDRNFPGLMRRLSSGAFLGHIRAATIGSSSFANSHPFVFGSYAFVHNGTWVGFSSVRRARLAKLDEDFFEAIEGRTDSEFLFYELLQVIRDGASWIEAVKSVFAQIQRDQFKASEPMQGSLNVVLTDGKQWIATRFGTQGHTPATLFYRTLPEGELLIASEPLTENEAWVAFEPQTGLYVSEDGSLEFFSL